MKKYLKKLALFSIPLIMFFGLPLFILSSSREMISDNKIIKLETAQTPTLLGKLIIPQSGNFVMQNIVSRCPEVLALGNSRALEFRQEEFAYNTFYNAGSSIPAISYLNKTLDKIPTSCSPKLMIIVLDQSYFNPANKNLNEGTISGENYHGITFDTLIISMRTCWINLIKTVKSKANWFKIIKPATGEKIIKIGLNAVLNDEGLRSDGSNYNALKNNTSHNLTPRDHDFKISLSYVKEGNNKIYTWGDSVDQNSINELGVFLQKCQERNIEVVAFIPPYAPTVYKAMEESKNYSYVNKIYPNIKSIFSQHGFEIYDYTSIPGLKDQDFFDGVHGTEKTYLQILLQMTRDGKILKKYINYENLLRKFLDNTNNVRVF